MVHEEEILAKGQHLLLIRRDNWEYVERRYATGVVVIAATTDNQELILTEQYRIPVQSIVIEMPAGLVGDSKDCAKEDAFAAATRELIEETGYKAKQFTKIISGPSSPGMSNEIQTIFHATGLTKIGQGGGVHDEKITVHLVSLNNVFSWLQQMAAQGRLIDPKILAALFYLLNSGSSVPK